MQLPDGKLFKLKHPNGRVVEMPNGNIVEMLDGQLVEMTNGQQLEMVEGALVEITGPTIHFDENEVTLAPAGIRGILASSIASRGIPTSQVA